MYKVGGGIFLITKKGKTIIYGKRKTYFIMKMEDIFFNKSVHIHTYLVSLITYYYQ